MTNYILIKFRTDQLGLNLNGWEIWVDKRMWDSFVLDVNEQKFPLIYKFGRRTLKWNTKDEFLECFKVQDISLEDIIKLETLLIDTIGNGDDHYHVEYNGFFPNFHWVTGHWVTGWMEKY